MKVIIRKQFVPNFYYRELFQKLQSSHQGLKSMEDYHKEMEIAMIRDKVVEDMKATMTRFLNGLNGKTTNVVELQHFIVLEDVIHMDMKMER
jgi:hypothetical protein